MNFSCLAQAEVLLGHTHRLVAQPDDVRDRTGSTILHDNPQVCVLEITAVVLYNIRATNKNQHSGVKKRVVAKASV